MNQCDNLNPRSQPVRKAAFTVWIRQSCIVRRNACSRFLANRGLESTTSLVIMSRTLAKSAADNFCTKMATSSVTTPEASLSIATALHLGSLSEARRADISALTYCCCSLERKAFNSSRRADGEMYSPASVRFRISVTKSSGVAAAESGERADGDKRGRA